MKRFKVLQACLASMMLILSVFLITGCGSSDEAALITAAQDAVIPGTCTENGPQVTSSTPTDNIENVAINATITAYFDQAMDPTRLVVNNPGDPEVLTFTLRDNDHLETTIKGTVAMAGLNTIAIFTPSANLSGDSWYTVTITTYAKSAGGISLGCSYIWSFKTAVVP